MSLCKQCWKKGRIEPGLISAAIVAAHNVGFSCRRARRNENMRTNVYDARREKSTIVRSAKIDDIRSKKDK